MGNYLIVILIAYIIAHIGTKFCPFKFNTLVKPSKCHSSKSSWTYYV